MLRKSRILTLLQRYGGKHGSVSFWHTHISDVIYDFRSLDDYYIDFVEKTNYAGPYDKNGIPMLEYFGEIGCQYNPCAVAQYALGHYQLFRRKGVDKNRAIFIKMSDWLVDTLIDSPSSLAMWFYNFDLDAYNITKPWPSALAQSQGVSVLVRAYKLTGEERYKHAAALAIKPLVENVNNGGLLYEDDTGSYLEEIVADKKTGILDGMIFAVFGLYDYGFVIKDEKVSRVLVSCELTIRKMLPEYDVGYWSRADLYQKSPFMLASFFYHNLHVKQLNVLYSLTGELEYKLFSKKWDEYQKSLVNKARALFHKIYFKIRYY